MIKDQVFDRVLKNYFHILINSFFKILPMKENGENSLSEYMKSFQLELIGYESFIKEIDYDASVISLISILQYLIEHDCNVDVTKREVFKAIGICKRLRGKYCREGDEYVEHV